MKRSGEGEEGRRGRGVEKRSGEEEEGWERECRPAGGVAYEEPTEQVPPSTGQLGHHLETA